VQALIWRQSHTSVSERFDFVIHSQTLLLAMLYWFNIGSYFVQPNETIPKRGNRTWTGEKGKRGVTWQSVCLAVAWTGFCEL